MNWSEASIRFLVQDSMACRICFNERKRYHTYPTMLIGGSAVLGPKTDTLHYERLHGKGSYKRAVVRRLIAHLHEHHADHPLVRSHITG